MIIDNFHIVRVRVLPTETDAPLVIHSDAVLAFAVALQSFQPIARWNNQLSQVRGGVQ
jgi:hypothetical protein